MDADDLPLDRLSHWTRLLAAVALLPAAAAAAWLWINAPYFAGLYVICAMLIAAPLLAVTRRAFVVLCLIIAGLFVPLSILGVFLGLFLFFPAAVVLLAAAGLVARSPGARVVARVAAWLVALGALAGFGLAFADYLSPPSNILIVQESAPDQDSARQLALLGSINNAGFTGVGVGTWTGDRELSVVPQGQLSERDRQRLLTFVRAQPGVVTAYWCQGTQCHG